ncbi:hypothetical protein [Methanobrevibacter arboriphilus]|uniref:hypothetical protein n=1 Tax=Methanobrevibacter arboriphilus TaxID=39441 RepID=UPI000A6BACC9|nr:hypothetical protein [Methanobrevibacter arboriphilus]
MGTEFLKIKEADEAKEIIKNLFDELYPQKSINIPIEDSHDQVIFKDIDALMDLPPHLIAHLWMDML